jgi:AraC family transcriptional regulator
LPYNRAKVEPLLINPPAKDLGQVNAILSGRSCRYGVREFPGPLSVKSVVTGAAVWQTGAHRHTVEAGSSLVLNDGQAYSIEIESRTPVETFCIFFRRGYVEDAARVARARTELLLDDPEGVVTVHFPTVICSAHGALARAVASCRTDREYGVIRVAEVLAGLHRLPSARLSTRDELLRRVMRGRDYLEANCGRPVRLGEAACEACLSPFHFHRAFRAAFGEAPHAFVARLRLDSALAALRGSEEPITEVALRSGFETHSAFTTAFRKRFGQAPREFRKNEKVP